MHRADPMLTPPLRIIMIGGFLGAGKTTALANLARRYVESGLKVALVTNDQAYGLVDTETLRAQGFTVGEVPGACFCCKFDELVETVAGLTADQRPDIVLTEPVGSCTDLMATVVRPLAHLYGDEYRLGPLAVLCKPEHGLKILGGKQSGFSPQAGYIFRKQLEEAEVIVLNKIDKIASDQRAELLQLLRQQFGDKKVLAVSAREGTGMETLVEALADDPDRDGPAMDVDYDRYAQGEAEMGWLNATVRMETSDPKEAEWAIDAVALELVDACSRGLLDADAEPGHVKVLASAALADGGLATAVANWVASDEPIELSVRSRASVPAADMLVNARVSGAPDMLAGVVERAARNVAGDRGLLCRVADMQHFRPGRPEPTHRYG